MEYNLLIWAMWLVAFIGGISCWPVVQTVAGTVIVQVVYVMLFMGGISLSATGAPIALALFATWTFALWGLGRAIRLIWDRLRKAGTDRQAQPRSLAS